jgi:hypothetical protein
MYFVSSQGPTGIREFDRSFTLAFTLSVLTTALRWRWISKQAGPPLVRLSGTHGSRELLGLSLVALLFYLAGMNFGWGSTWIAYVTGIGFWWTTLRALYYLFPRQVDLRRDGVCIPGDIFLPWVSVKVIRWNHERSGRLVFASGWRRIAAIVPPEQRDVVHALLQDKLPCGRQ